MGSLHNRVLLSLPALPRPYSRRSGERLTYSTFVSADAIALSARACWTKGSDAPKLPTVLGTGALRAQAVSRRWQADGFRLLERRWEWRVARDIRDAVGPFELELDEDRDLLVWFDPAGRARLSRSRARLDAALAHAVDVATAIAGETRGARVSIDRDRGIVRVRNRRVSLDDIEALRRAHEKDDVVVLGEGRGPYTLVVAATLGPDRRPRGMSRTVELALETVASPDEETAEDRAPSVTARAGVAAVTLSPVGDGLWPLLEAFEKSGARILALHHDRVIVRAARDGAPTLKRQPAATRAAIAAALERARTVALVFRS